MTIQHVRGKNHTVAASFTRPANTTAYTIGDVVADSTSAATVLTFARATLGQGEGGVIAQLLVTDSANQTTKLDGRLWLFDTAPASYGNDADAFVPTDAEMRTCIGYIDIPVSQWVAGDATSGAGGNAINDVQDLAIPFNTTVTENAIYGVLQTLNAYTPVSGEQFDFRLKIVD